MEFSYSSYSGAFPVYLKMLLVINIAISLLHLICFLKALFFLRNIKNVELGLSKKRKGNEDGINVVLKFLKNKLKNRQSTLGNKTQIEEFKELINTYLNRIRNRTIIYTVIITTLLLYEVYFVHKDFVADSQASGMADVEFLSYYLSFGMSNTVYFLLCSMNFIITSILIYIIYRKRTAWQI